MTVQSIKRGAIDFIEKPFRNSVMLTRIKEAIEMDRRRAEKQAVWGELRIRFATLTRRETEIADLLADGKQNKEIAATLDISPRTVESHRASIMSKLNVRTISALTRVVLEFRGS